MHELGRMLLLLGGVLIIAGALLFFGARPPLRLGRLPGDILWSDKNTTFYFPIVTCLALSLLLTVIFWLAGHFRR